MIINFSFWQVMVTSTRVYLMIQSSPVHIPAITILVRPSKYFDKFSASTNSLLNSVKMTFDITKMCCFPLNNREGQVLWEQSSATASITQTSPYLSMGCCALHSVHGSPHEDKSWGTSTWLGQRKVIWRVGSTMLDARAMPMCGSQLQKQHLCSHEWDSWEAQCVILKAAPHEKQGLTSSGEHNPTAWCAYNAVVAVCLSPHRKSEMDHKAEADDYWKILTCQPPAFTSSFKGES